MSIIFLCLCLFTVCKRKQRFVCILKKALKTVKGHQYGYQMKGFGLGSKNMLFIFLFSCLITFFKHNRAGVLTTKPESPILKFTF
jgi:hypothetical protein